MSTLYDPTDFVSLPRLDADGARALIAALLQAAHDSNAKKKLPAAIAKAWKTLRTRLDALVAVLQQRLAAPAVDTKRAIDADRREDAGWSALFDWLSGWQKLAELAGRPVEARRLVAILFPDGLKFLRLAFAQEWSQVESRLQRILADGLEADIQKLGGAPFLQAIRAAHKEYGEVLGITAVKSVEAQAQPAAPVREALLAASDALRTYVLKVVAHIDEDEAETAELARELLAPLHDWQRKAAARSGAREGKGEEEDGEKEGEDGIVVAGGGGE